MKHSCLTNIQARENPVHSSLVWRGWRRGIMPLAGLMAFMSCEYKEIADAAYPASKLYLPAATTGIYKIENLTGENPATPTPGSTYRYVINTEENQFEIPLAVFRSGLDRSNSVNIHIAANADTVQSLINDGTLDGTETTILPPGAYRLNETAVMTGGSSVSPFTLSLDLNYIRTQVEEDRRKKEEDRKNLEEEKRREEEAKAINPDTVYVPAYVSNYFSMKYAAGISISSDAREVNPNLNTVIVCLDIRIFSPEASFEYATDAENPKLVSFLNRSGFAVAYLWNFGDGKTSAEATPKHTYEATGVYTVTLKATGLLEDVVSYTETIEIK